MPALCTFLNIARSITIKGANTSATGDLLAEIVAIKPISATEANLNNPRLCNTLVEFKKANLQPLPSLPLAAPLLDIRGVSLGSRV